MGQDEPIERWTAKRRAALVLRVLKGETSVAEAARQHGLTVAEVEGELYWKVVHGGVAKTRRLGLQWVLRDIYHNHTGETPRWKNVANQQKKSEGARIH